MRSLVGFKNTHLGGVETGAENECGAAAVGACEAEQTEQTQER